MLGIEEISVTVVVGRASSAMAAASWASDGERLYPLF